MKLYKFYMFLKLLYGLRRSWSLRPLERPSTAVSARAVHPCRLSFRSGLDENKHVALTDGSVNLPAVASVRSARPCRPPVPFARGSVNPPPVASVRSVRPRRPPEPSVRAACPFSALVSSLSTAPVRIVPALAARPCVSWSCDATAPSKRACP